MQTAPTTPDTAPIHFALPAGAIEAAKPLTADIVVTAQRDKNDRYRLHPLDPRFEHKPNQPFDTAEVTRNQMLGNPYRHNFAYIDLREAKDPGELISHGTRINRRSVGGKSREPAFGWKIGVAFR